MPLLLTRFMWTLFALSVAALIAHAAVGINGALGTLLRVDGLTLVMAVVITFVSGIIHSFARRYMAGSQHLGRFYGRLFGLTLIVLLLTAADHLVLFAGAWTAMGWLLADLIGTIRGWTHAQAAARRARWTFLAGSALLAGALACWLSLPRQQPSQACCAAWGPWGRGRSPALPVCSWRRR